MKALGDYCGGVPPLPIPNREVKTASADGTAFTCGRVGRRHSLIASDSLLSRRLFFAINLQLKLSESISFRYLTSGKICKRV
jgi:hypothetical protein